MPDQMEGDVNAGDDSHASQQSPSQPSPPPIKRNENGKGEDDKYHRKKVKEIKEPKHWIEYVEGLCAIALVVITGTYTFYAGKQVGEMKHTNELTQQAIKGSDLALSETLVEMEGQIDQMSRLADNANAQAGAARDSANTAISALKDARASYRPWVGISGFYPRMEQAHAPVAVSGVYNPGQAVTTVYVLISNTGRIPARHVKGIIGFYEMPRNYVPTVEDGQWMNRIIRAQESGRLNGIRDVTSKQHNFPLPADVLYDPKLVPIGKDDIYTPRDIYTGALASGTQYSFAVPEQFDISRPKTLTVFGQIEYSEVLHTTFCFFSDDINRPNSFGACPVYNDME